MYRNILIAPALLGVVALAGIAPLLQAQAADPQARVAALKAALAENAAAQRGYTWLETTELALNGEVKSTQSSSCQYVPGSNKPACTPVAPAPDDKKRRGPVRNKVVEKKTGELKTYMDSAKTLMSEYVPPKADLIQAAQGRGDVAVAPDPAAQTVKLTVSNYLEKGDALSLVLNPATNALVHANINSWLNDPSATVTLAVQFQTLPNGVTFPSRKVLTATAKGVVVTITSSNFAQAVAQ